MAAAEQIERGYLGRVLRLTLLAPDIVEAILDGRQPADLALPALLQPFPADWERQRDRGFLVSRSDDPAAPRPPAAVRYRAHAPRDAADAGTPGGGPGMSAPPDQQAEPPARAVTSASRRPGTPAAERKRRQRQREREQTLIYETEDWRLFTDLATLPQKAGCQPEDLRKVVLKELVDNALDAGAAVSLDHADGAWIVTDDGPGLDPAEVPRLFAVDRPLLQLQAGAPAAARHARQRPARGRRRRRRDGGLPGRRDPRPPPDARRVPGDGPDDGRRRTSRSRRGRG